MFEPPINLGHLGDSPVRDTLRYVLAAHVADIYDDPDGTTPEILVELDNAAAVVGLDIWDTAQIELVCGYHVSSHEVSRLNAIARPAPTRP